VCRTYLSNKVIGPGAGAGGRGLPDFRSTTCPVGIV